jgi:hypothetical protein
MTSVTRKPMELHRGDTIRRHPDRPGQAGRWTVQSRAYSPGDMVTITYTCDHGAEGVFVVDPVAELTVDVEPRTAMVAALRQAATWLEAHPDVPVSEYDRVELRHILFGGTPAAERAEVDRVAEVMDGTIRQDRHYEASHRIGPFEYMVIACNNPAPEPTTDAEGAGR